MQEIQHPAYLPESAQGGKGRQGADQLRLVVRIPVVPLPGREGHDFFAFASHAEPRTAYVDSAVKPGRAPADLCLQYVAGLLELPHGLGIVPDFEAIKAAFYG